MRPAFAEDVPVSVPCGDLAPAVLVFIKFHVSALVECGMHGPVEVEAYGVEYGIFRHQYRHFRSLAGVVHLHGDLRIVVPVQRDVEHLQVPVSRPSRCEILVGVAAFLPDADGCSTSPIVRQDEQFE